MPPSNCDKPSIVTAPWWAEHGVPSFNFIRTLIEQNQEHALLSYGCISSKGCPHRAYRRCRAPIEDFSFARTAEDLQAYIDRPSLDKAEELIQNLTCCGYHDAWNHHVKHHWIRNPPNGRKGEQITDYGPPPCSLCTVARDEAEDGRTLYVTSWDEYLMQKEAVRDQTEQLRLSLQKAEDEAVDIAGWNALSLTWA